MSEFSASRPERRQTPRTKLAEVAYIGMGPENGGLILDVSDGGLSFHSVAPVRPAETIRFLLSARGQTRIEGAGEVVWTDEMRTVCGLKFTSLSAGAREYLNNWANQSGTTASSDAPALPAEEETASVESQAEANAEPLFAIPPANEFFLLEPEGRSWSRGQLFFWIALALMGAAALVGSAYLYGVHVGQTEVSQVASPETPVAATPSEPPTLTPPPAALPTTESAAPPASQAAASASTGASSIPNVDASSKNNALANTSQAADATVNSTQSTGALGTAAAADQRDEQATDAGKSQLAAAMAYLNGQNGPRDSSKAAKLLWAAVGNRNSDAEIILAGLYLAGDGVPKSCEQGRVLLIAAVRSGNATARLRLHELNANGCP